MSAAQSQSSSVKLILKSVLLGCRVKYCTSCPPPSIQKTRIRLTLPLLTQPIQQEPLEIIQVNTFFPDLFCLSNFTLRAYRHCLQNCCLRDFFYQSINITFTCIIGLISPNQQMCIVHLHCISINKLGLRSLIIFQKEFLMKAQVSPTLG